MLLARRRGPLVRARSACHIRAPPFLGRNNCRERPRRSLSSTTQLSDRWSSSCGTSMPPASSTNKPNGPPDWWAICFSSRAEAYGFASVTSKSTSPAMLELLTPLFDPPKLGVTVNVYAPAASDVV